MFTFIAIFLFTQTLAAESPNVQRITLEKAQALAGAAKVASLGQLGIDAARYHREAVQADYFPKISSTFANLHFNKFMGQSIQLARRTAQLPLVAKDETVAAFTLTQPLTPLFKIREAVAIARADEAIARAKAAQLAAQVGANVERTYFALLIAQRQRSPAAKDLTQALSVMLGFSPDTELELTPPQPMNETISLQQVTQQAIATSPEIVEAEQTVVKARAATKISKLDYVPDIAVIGGYVYQTAIPLLPKDFTYIGVIASLNIFDFGKREKTISERQTQLSMAEANVELVKAKVAANAQKAFLDLERTRKIRDLTRRVVTGVAYEPGAEAEMFQAELDYRAAYFQLKQVAQGQ